MRIFRIAFWVTLSNRTLALIGQKRDIFGIVFFVLGIIFLYLKLFNYEQIDNTSVLCIVCLLMLICSNN